MVRENRAVTERHRVQDQIRAKYGDDYINALRKQYCAICTFSAENNGCKHDLLPINSSGSICLYHSAIKAGG